MAHSASDIESRYSVNLGDLHSICEANYLRLTKAFPGYENTNRIELVSGVLSLRIEVIERCRYTTTLRLVQIGPATLPRAVIRLDVRLYHDAKMAEVVMLQRHNQLQGRYHYPNPAMYQRDEKLQQNHYVAELLSILLISGYTPNSAVFSVSDER